MPQEAEDRIISNIDPYYAPIIKGDCILNKDTICSLEIKEASLRFEEVLDSYDGDLNLEAGYKD